jgi:hypothetical protein
MGLPAPIQEPLDQAARALFLELVEEPYVGEHAKPEDLKHAYDTVDKAADAVTEYLREN